MPALFFFKCMCSLNVHVKLCVKSLTEWAACWRFRVAEAAKHMMNLTLQKLWLEFGWRTPLWFWCPGSGRHASGYQFETGSPATFLLPWSLPPVCSHSDFKHSSWNKIIRTLQTWNKHRPQKSFSPEADRDKGGRQKLFRSRIFSSRWTGRRPEVWRCCNSAAFKVNRTNRTWDVFQCQASL